MTESNFLGMAWRGKNKDFHRNTIQTAPLCHYIRELLIKEQLLYKHIVLEIMLFNTIGIDTYICCIIEDIINHVRGI